MPVLRNWELIIDVDQVLRGQGADPAMIRQRSPRLVDLAERVIEDESSLLKPALLYRRMKVNHVIHERISLEGGGELRGKLPATHLAPASEVVVILCTIGLDLEERISQVMKTDLVYALALDGLGSAGVEALANAACRKFEAEAEKMNLEATIPLSPGMIDWSVEDGQPQIFDLLPTEEIGVELTSSSVMIPRKSLSMLLGIGKHMIPSGTICDYCSMAETCRYQDHDSPVTR
jgi:hypothetical protein